MSPQVKAVDGGTDGAQHTPVTVRRSRNAFFAQAELDRRLR